MKYEIKVKLVDKATGEIALEDSITYHENMLEMALEFVVNMANVKSDYFHTEFEIVKEKE